MTVFTLLLTTSAAAAFSHAGGTVPAARRIALAPAVTQLPCTLWRRAGVAPQRYVRVVLQNEAPAADDTVDAMMGERECFGAEADDGCDAWYYGEDPDDDTVAPVPSPEQQASLKSEGQAAFAARRAREDETEAVLKRLRSM